MCLLDEPDSVIDLDFLPGLALGLAHFVDGQALALLDHSLLLR